MPVEERPAENLLSIPFGSNASFPAEIMYCGGISYSRGARVRHRVIGARNRIEFRPPSSKTWEERAAGDSRDRDNAHMKSGLKLPDNR